MIRYRKIVGGPLETNTYIIYSENSGIVVDPGVNPDSIMKVIEELGVTKVYSVIATHGHFDHVFYAGRVSRLLSTRFLIHELDIGLISRYKFLAEELYGDVLELPESIELVKSDVVLRFKELEVKILHTPGHTRGSLCLLVGNLLVSGDTLFKGTIGRVDFPESSAEDMKSSLIKLVKLSNNYVILPGHGEVTTLDQEKRNNQYLRRLLE
ncbi:MAG: MBL fold metallo-hydrolase [Zestosphaera sp.]